MRNGTANCLAKFRKRQSGEYVMRGKIHGQHSTSADRPYMPPLEHPPRSDVGFNMNTMCIRFLPSLLVLTPLCANAQISPSPTVPTPTATPYFNRTPVPGVSASPSPSPMVGASPLASPGNWDPFADMQRMQTEMNQFFSRAMGQFGMNQNFLSMRNEPGFSSSIDVRDKGDHYEVHAFLPGSEINNVKVTAEPNNRLRVSASQSKQEKKESKAGETFTSEFGEYEQVVTLPGPARTKDMKIERKEHEVVVSIPKKD